MKNSVLAKLHWLIQSSYLNAAVGLVIIAIGIWQASAQVNDRLSSWVSQGYKALTLYGAAQFVYSLTYVFRGASYIDKWALLHTWPGVRGGLLAGLHLLTEDPHVNMLAGMLMILAGLPGVWTSLTDNLPGIASPASFAIVFYGLFNVLKCLVPILLGITYFQKGRLVMKTPKGPPA